MGKKYVIRSSPLVLAALALASLILMVSLALPVLLANGTRSFWPTLLGSIFVIALLDATYLSVFKVRVSLGSSIEIAAPLWRKEIAYSDVSVVSAEEDSGLNSGAINWPVVKNSGGYRVSMGGKFRVTLVLSSGRSYEIVMEDEAQALDFMQALEQVRESRGLTAA